MGERASEGERVSEKVRERLCVGENEMRISLFMDLSLNQVFCKQQFLNRKFPTEKLFRQEL